MLGIILGLLETCICCSFKISEFMTFSLSRPGIYSLLHLTKNVKTRAYVNSIPMSSILQFSPNCTVFDVSR